MKTDKFNYIERLLFYLFRRYLNDYYYAFFSLKRWFGRASLNPPVTFNEKLQWLKIFDRRDQIVSLADKSSVRDFVEKKIGINYLNEVYGVWEKLEDINFKNLPSSFVIKATHGSGMNYFVRDKAKENEDSINDLCSKWLDTDYGISGREWMYSKMKPKIIAEKLILDNQGKVPKDYKVFCFNGKAKFIAIDVDRFENQRRCFYDINWVKQNFTTLHKIYEGDIPRPSNLDELLFCAETLAETFKFVRVDFYLTDKLIFGEMTFFPGNCTEPFYPDSFDFELGKYLII
jgi:hypothetical protein